MLRGQGYPRRPERVSARRRRVWGVRLHRPNQREPGVLQRWEIKRGGAAAGGGEPLHFRITFIRRADADKKLQKSREVENCEAR